MSTSEFRSYTDDDIKTVIEKYWFFLERLEFDEAQSYLNNQQMLTSSSPHAADRVWQDILRAIAQLATAEHSYFGLGFLVPKSLFRNQTSAQLRDTYFKIGRPYRGELRRINEAARSEGGVTTAPLRKTIVEHFVNHCEARYSLITFYNELQSKNYDELVAISPDKLKVIIKDYGNTKESDLFIKTAIISRELQLLLTAFQIKQELAKADMFNALLLLKQLQSQYSAFFRDITPNAAAKNSSSSFFNFFGKPPKAAKLGLLTWFKSLYDALLSKFSFYFMDVLLPYTPAPEVRPCHTACFANVNIFQRKCAPVAIMIVMYLSNDEKDSFAGFGYKHPDTIGFTIGPPKAAGQIKANLAQTKSINVQDNRFPMLLCLTSDKQKLNDQHSRVIYQRLAKLVPSAMDWRTKYELDERENNTTFCARIEQKLFFTIFFDRKINERESAVTNFITETLNQLRFTKLYQELRSPSKAHTPSQSHSSSLSSSSLPGGPLM
uniref:UPF0536 protein C12orf66 n=1 Tax=Panagrellus redivivus TaxID=6233 RepID=A0A7E4WDI5_PANRE